MLQPSKKKKPEISVLNDEDELRVWLNMAELHVVYDAAKANEYAKRAKKLSAYLNDLESYAKALNLIGHANYVKGKYKAAKPYLTEALGIINEINDEQTILKIYLNLSNVEYESGDLFQALEYIFLAKDLSEKLEDKETLTRCLLGIGMINHKLGNTVSAIYYQSQVQSHVPQIGSDSVKEKTYADLGASYCLTQKFDEAEIYLSKAIELNKASGNVYSFTQNLSNLGWALIQNQKFKQAENTLREAENVLDQISENRLNSYVFKNLAIALSKQNQQKQAIEYYQKAIGLNPKVEDRWISLLCNIGIAHCHKQMKAYKKAERFALKALKISSPIKALDETKKIYSLLIELSIEQDDYKSAFKYQQELSNFKDDLSDVEAKEIQATLQKQFKNIEKTKELDQHKLLLKGERRLNEMLVKYNKEIEEKTANIQAQQAELEQINTQLKKEIYDRELMETRLKENERFLHSIISHMPVLVNVINPDGIIVLSNGEKVARDNNWEFQNFIGRSVSDLPSSINAVKQFNLTKNGQKVVFDTSFNKQHFQNHTIPIMNHENELQFIISVSTDVSQIMLMKNQLELVNSELRNFAYAASHDMKEPLRNIQSFGRLLARKIYADLDESAQEYMDFILSSSKRMGVLIDDLLTYASTGKNLKAPKPIDLNDTVSVVEDNLKLKIKERGAKIIVKKLPVVRAHFSMMTQLFQNLISNAIKFQQKGKTAEVVVCATEIGKEYATICVKDNGIGIEKKYLDEIFTVFRRLNARSDYEGSGIGMATCKKIINAYKAKIWVESEVGKGTSFYFTLPIK